MNLRRGTHSVEHDSLPGDVLDGADALSSHHRHNPHRRLRQRRRYLAAATVALSYNLSSEAAARPQPRPRCPATTGAGTGKRRKGSRWRRPPLSRGDWGFDERRRGEGRRCRHFSCENDSGERMEVGVFDLVVGGTLWRGKFQMGPPLLLTEST